MPLDAREKAEAFKREVEEKIRGLITEFAEGAISREQFHALYERYNSRLQIANEALMTNNPDAVSIAMGGTPTFAVRKAAMGRALGILIYHYKSSLVLETLGEFDVPEERVSPALTDYTKQRDADMLVESRAERLDGLRWLLYDPGRYTIVVTLFLNEPSQMQIREIVRLHHDFEVANRNVLQSSAVDSTRLAFPFLVFIQKKFGGANSE